MNHSRETDRLHQELRTTGCVNFPEFTEFELTEQVLSSEEFTFDDLRSIIEDQADVIWIGDAFAFGTHYPNLGFQAVNSFDEGTLTFTYNFAVGACFQEDSWSTDLNIYTRLSVFSRTLAETSPAADFLVRLFTRDARFGYVYIIGQGADVTTLPLSDTALELVIQSNLPQVLHFGNITITERQSFLLARFPNEHVMLSFAFCSFQDDGDALANAITNNEGICKIAFHTNLTSMSTDNVNRFFNGLRRNTSVKELILDHGFLHRIDETQTLTVFAPLTENRGLETLSVCVGSATTDKLRLFCSMVQENRWLKKLILQGVGSWQAEQWGVFARSIRNHPSIEEIDMPHGGYAPWMAAFAFWIMPFWIMLETNTVIRRISIPGVVFYESVIYQTEIWPRLAMNRFRPLFAAIKQEHNETLRAKLFRWALQIIQSDPKYASCRSDLLKQLVFDNPDLVMEYYV